MTKQCYFPAAIETQGDLGSYLQKKGRIETYKALKFALDIARYVLIASGNLKLAFLLLPSILFGFFLLRPSLNLYQFIPNKYNQMVTNMPKIVVSDAPSSFIFHISCVL